MDLNKLNAKLVKAEMLNQTDLVDRYRREIEALKRNVSNQISSGHQPTLHGCTSTSRSTKPDLLDQLNKLNSKLTKAEFLCQSDLVEQYKNEIQLLQDKYEKCLDEKQTANRKSAVSGDKAYTDELNKLGSKLAKAELLNQTDLIVKYKSQIEQLKSGNSKSSELIAVGDDSSKRKQTEKALERLNPEEYSKELNRLGSRLAKAEMMNQVDLVDLLQSQIDQLKRRHGHETDMKEELEEDINRELSNRYHSSYNNKKQINERDGGSDGSTFTQSGSYGPSRQPFYLKASGLDRSKSADGKSTSFGQSRKLIEFTKKISENNMSLKQMFVKERGPSAEDEAKHFMKNSAKFLNVDDEYEGSGSKRKKTNQDGDEYIRREVDDEDEPCKLCAIHFPPHLLLFYNERVYVSVPEKSPLLDRQLIIRPLSHAASLIQAGEEVAQDVNQIRHVLAAMFSPNPVLFVETYFRSHRWQRHFEIHCFPIATKHVDQLRMGFRKAISECEHEWTVNRKLIKVDKPVTRCLPKGLSYFWVQFGGDPDGYAHVIENDEDFSTTFAEEIIAGILNISHVKWKKPSMEKIDQQAKRIDTLRPLWEKHNTF